MQSQDNPQDISAIPRAEIARQNADLSAVHGRELLALADTITVEDIEFRNFPHSPDIQTISQLTRQRMHEMNAAFPGLPPDSFERTRELLTQPGSHTVILRGVFPGDPEQKPRILGYGIIICGLENFPDRENIPQHLTTSSQASRVIRLFVTTEARQVLPYGEAFTRIVDKIKEIGGAGPIIGMVLTDIVPIQGEFDASMSTEIWQEARRALEVRGFEDTEERFTEEISHRENQQVAVNFQWYVYPPFSPEGKQSLASHAQRYAALEEWRREPLASLVTAIPATDIRVLVHSPRGRAYDIARIYPSNMVIGSVYDSGDPAAQERRANLLLQKPATDGIHLPRNSVGAVVVSGVIPDIINNSPLTPREALSHFIAGQAGQLQYNGMMVIRDTVGPADDSHVIAHYTPDIAKRFREFLAGPHEPHLDPEEWAHVYELPADPESGDARFLASHQLTDEFLLKFLYFKDQERERGRCYTALTSDDRVRLMQENGLRLLYAGPETGMWFRNQLHDGVRLTDISGQEVSIPPSNYVTIAEKVSPDEGAVIQHTTTAVEHNPHFVSIHSFQEVSAETGQITGVREIATRPNITHDVIAHTISGGHLFLQTRIYPRPLLLTHDHLLDHSRIGGYVAEQVAGIVTPERIATEASAEDSARAILSGRAGIRQDQIQEIGPRKKYFSRPDVIDEEVCVQTVRVSDDLRDREVQTRFSDFAPSATLRMIDAQRVLHGCQTGGFDARIERAVYDLLRQYALPAGPWMGEKINLTTQQCTSMLQSPLHDLLNPAARRGFQPLGTKQFGFFEVRRETFDALRGNGEHLASVELESVVPKNPRLSWNSAPVIFALRVQNPGTSEVTTLFGVENRDFPSLHGPDNTVTFAAAPTFHLPLDVRSVAQAKEHIRDRIENEYQTRVISINPVGGKYCTSPGITPEYLYPMIVELDAASAHCPEITWFSPDVLQQHIKDIRCGQLITLINRASHALGVLS